MRKSFRRAAFSWLRSLFKQSAREVALRNLFLNCKCQTTNILRRNYGESRARFHCSSRVPCGVLAGYSYQVGVGL